MAKHKFDIGFNKPIKKLVKKAKDGISEVGGEFEGDLESGSYSIPTAVGKITGTYSVSHSVMTFVITRKPAFVTYKRIEKELRKYLS